MNLNKFIFSLSLMVFLPLTSCNKTETKSTYYSSSSVTSTLPIKDAVSSYVNKVDVNYGYNLACKLAYDQNYSQCLGWRLAGSDAEHKTAYLLKDEFINIGLKEENVKMVKLPCDSFNFYSSSLTIDGREDVNITPASYQVDGTFDDDGNNITYSYPIIDLGTGSEKEYNSIITDDIKSTGYIALVGVNQTEDWIDIHIKQAKVHDAKALITYSIGGYGTEDESITHVTDVCSGNEHVIPTCAISLKEAKQIKSIIKDSTSIKCNLNLNAKVNEYDETSETNPYTYDVYGVLPGKDRSKQIVIGGHYDKYWYGFQDDSAAIGLIFTVLKSLIESNYTPEHDIVVCCSGAEEWGKADSPADWTTGAWELLENDKDWADKTIALLNCELPASRPDEYHQNSILSLGSVPEFRSLVNTFINDTGLIVTSGDIKINREGFDSVVQEDGIAYRYHGVPYFINYFSDDKFQSHKYHTSYDSIDTYDKDTFLTNINMYGALAIYLDNLAVAPIDYTYSQQNLSLSLNDIVNNDAGIESSVTTSYKEALTNLNNKAVILNNKINDLNNKMWDARKNNDTSKIDTYKNEGLTLHNKIRKIYKTLQEEFLKVNDFSCYYGHYEFNKSYINLANAIKDISYKNKVMFLESCSAMNAGHASSYVKYNKEVGLYDYNRYIMSSSDTIFKKQWMYNRLDQLVDLTTIGNDINGVALGTITDLSTIKSNFETVYNSCKEKLKTILNTEITSLNTINSLF